jgi:radical SAM family RiPP maturation amino acid epimerase
VNHESEQISVLGKDAQRVSAEYLRDVAHTKRFLERWTMDPSFRDRYTEDPAAAIGSLGLVLTAEQLDPLLSYSLATEITERLAAGEQDACPESVKRYRAFINEKKRHRAVTRNSGEPSDPRLAAWRARQVERCRGELGPSRAEAIVHAPVTFELSKGCTVGCWFCGVAAPDFDHNLEYTEENARLWTGVLEAVRDVVGEPASQGFLYWATDPLDNPDYESYLAEFHRVFGRCPQTTTAIAHKDVERTRRLLDLGASLGSFVDRFSIISLKFLDIVHEAFTPEEMLRVECVAQNRESSDKHLKSNSGRARQFANGKRASELAGEQTSSTIACVSGFLFNMVERSVKLITPCNSSDRWPLGYWIVDEGTFDTAEELRALLEKIIANNCRRYLGVDDTVRLRNDVRISVEDDRVLATSLGIATTLGPLPDAQDVARWLGEGALTVEQIATLREERSGVSPVETMVLLDQLFVRGLTNEEPAEPPASATPAPRGRARKVSVTLQSTR